MQETKKSELHVKIDQTKRSIVEHTASIEAMKSRRDRILSETAEFERELEVTAFLQQLLIDNTVVYVLHLSIYFL